MNHSEAAIAALYDHEQEPARERELEAPDWGGDELFSSTPRRRRFQPERQRLRETTEHPLPRLRAPHELTERVHRPEPRVPTPEEREEKLRLLESLERPELFDRFEISPSGRRSVLVTGHPERQIVRRRPALPVEQRFSHRPDRVAAIAFGLGLLLIVIAVLTAH